MLRALESQEPLRRYVEVKELIRALEAELQELQPALFDALTEEPEQRCSFAGYEFTVQSRRTWTYSEAIRRDEEELKARKRYEERAGIAEPAKVTGYVLMKALEKA